MIEVAVSAGSFSLGLLVGRLGFLVETQTGTPNREPEEYIAGISSEFTEPDR